MFIQKMKDIFKRFKKPGKSRTQVRKAVGDVTWNHLPLIRSLLFFSGYVWILLLPLIQLSQNIYIDENALQPGQVNTYWSWVDVRRADYYLGDLEALRDANVTTEERCSYVRDEFLKLGLASSTQNYKFDTSTGIISGCNAYAILSSPRTSGTETIVVSASWVSRTNEGAGVLNLRGVSTVLALAVYLNQHSLWSKDFAFVITDGYLDGMQAWINAYHGYKQENLDAETLQVTSGTIWTALNIDYPGHSFSHLGVYFEGLNGRFPNQDLINSFHIISRHSGGVPVVVYDHLDVHDNPNMLKNLIPFQSWLPAFLRDDWHVQDYAYRAKNLIRHFGFQSRGRASGVHGLLHPFRIDAITIFAVPAAGPHGFHALGRIVESTLRTTNNLLERLHASFFFYLLPEPASFLKIGFYLPSVVLVSTAMLFGGLGDWVRAGWTEVSAEKVGSSSKWERRARPASRAIGIMVFTHIVGAGLYFILSSTYARLASSASNATALTISLLPVVIAMLPAQHVTTSSASTSSLLKAFNLCFASAVISITSVLNFSLAVLLAIHLGLPLSFTRAASPWSRMIQYIIYMALALYRLFLKEEVAQAIWDWEVLNIWYAPFIFVVYIPLLLQGAICVLLPP